MKLLTEMVREVEHCLIIVLITLALVGYSEAQWPWMPEHESRVTVETIYWEG